MIAFDLDGTLVDSVGDIATALNGALADTGLAPLPVEVVRSYVGNGARMLVTRALAGRPGDFEGAVDDVLALFRTRYDQGLIEQTVAFEGIGAVLQELSQHARIAVATNKPGAPARAIVQALFPGLVDLVLGPDDVGALKPDPAMLRAVALSLAGEVCVFVGDSGVDRQTAHDAGVPFVGVAWGLRPEELDGCALAHDARELAVLVARYL